MPAPPKIAPQKIAPQKSALIVHPDVGVLSQLQGELTKNGLTAILARDLPSALLAINQHYFEFALVNAKISEEGDGWSLAGILRLVFPRIFTTMIAPQTDVLTLRSAINSGVDEVLESSATPASIAKALLQREAPPAGSRVQ